jgi:hypothetical protein
MSALSWETSIEAVLAVISLHKIQCARYLAHVAIVIEPF